MRCEAQRARIHAFPNGRAWRQDPVGARRVGKWAEPKARGGGVKGPVGGACAVSANSSGKLFGLFCIYWIRFFVCALFQLSVFMKYVRRDNRDPPTDAANDGDKEERP